MLIDMAGMLNATATLARDTYTADLGRHACSYHAKGGRPEVSGARLLWCAICAQCELVLPRFGTFSPYKAIFNSKGPNRGSTSVSVAQLFGLFVTVKK